MMEFRPYSKSEQLKGHQKDKRKPKIKEKRTYKKRKKLETFKGRTIPPSRARGSISKKEYKRAVEAFGSVCVFCANPFIEMHHIRFRSQQGRGGYRNLIPLCKEHHNHAHTNRAFADELRENREKIFGSWYRADKYDLFKAGLIPNTEDKSFEEFMQSEEKKAEEAQNTL